MGRDERPPRSEEAIHSSPTEPPGFRVPDPAVRLHIAPRGRKEKDRGSGQEDLRHYVLVLSDEYSGEKLVGEEGAVVPIEPRYA